MSNTWRSIAGNQHVFDALRNLLTSQRAVALVGAGASAGLYPLWGSLIQQLIDQVITRGLASEDDRAFWLRTQHDRPHQVVRAVKAKLGSSIYGNILYETFKPRVGTDNKKFTPTHEILAKLPFRGYATTNYDPGLLEATYALPVGSPTNWGTWKDNDIIHRWYTGEILEGSSPVLFIHGIYERSDTVVLGTGEYRDAYQPGPYRRLFEKLWSQDNLVFVGFGFSDPWFDFLADEVLSQTTRTAAGDSRHIAILGLRSDYQYSPEMRNLWHDQYNAQVLFYPIQVVDNREDHTALYDILSSLDRDLLQPEQASPDSDIISSESSHAVNTAIPSPHTATRESLSPEQPAEYHYDITLNWNNATEYQKRQILTILQELSGDVTLTITEIIE